VLQNQSCNSAFQLTWFRLPYQCASLPAGLDPPGLGRRHRTDRLTRSGRNLDRWGAIGLPLSFSSPPSWIPRSHPNLPWLARPAAWPGPAMIPAGSG